METKNGNVLYHSDADVTPYNVFLKLLFSS